MRIILALVCAFPVYNMATRHEEYLMFLPIILLQIFAGLDFKLFGNRY